MFLLLIVSRQAETQDRGTFLMGINGFTPLPLRPPHSGDSNQRQHRNRGGVKSHAVKHEGEGVLTRQAPMLVLLPPCFFHSSAAMPSP